MKTGYTRLKCVEQSILNIRTHSKTVSQDYAFVFNDFPHFWMSSKRLNYEVDQNSNNLKISYHEKSISPRFTNFCVCDFN